MRGIARVHFVGIGGIGMSGIAEVLNNQGYQVSGSDLKESAVTERLRGMGIQIEIGHNAGHITDQHVVVYSSAIQPDNPEIAEARRRSIPVIPRGEMLGELMRSKLGIAIAGAHGKTTTTSMVATVLDEAGLDPTAVIGSRVAAFGSNARLGGSEYLVAEADESDRSFLLLSPVIAVVTNLDREHLDCYSDLEDIKRSFVQFVNKVPFYGLVVVCLDDPHVRDILAAVARPRWTYGFGPDCDVRAVDLSAEGMVSRFSVERNGRRLGEATLQVPGKHNILNALAAISVGLFLDVDFETIVRGLRRFPGAERRFQIKGEVAGVTVVDDYGHHPTEVVATLAAARQCGFERIVVVFQPHRYTRTQHQFQEFAGSFSDADVLLVTDIYAAGERPIAGVDSPALVDAICRQGHPDARYVGAVDRVPAELRRRCRRGDLVLTLGAGDIYKVGEKFLKEAADTEPRPEGRGQK